MYSSTAPTDNAKLMDFYHKLAESCDLYVSTLYDNSPWAHRINAWPAGSEYVPAVKTYLSATLTWWYKGDGRIRIDAKTHKADAMWALLRNGFEEYVPGVTTHPHLTGRPTGRSVVQQGRPGAEETARRAREEQLRGKQLWTNQALVFTSDGERGIWDVLHKRIGLRAVPCRAQSPWTLFTRTGVLLTVWPDGRLKTSSTAGSVQQVEEVERELIGRIGAQWGGLRSHLDTEGAGAVLARLRKADPTAAAPKSDRGANSAKRQAEEFIMNMESAPYRSALRPPSDMQASLPPHVRGIPLTEVSLVLR